MELLAGFVFGFLGSLHCIGMCGPIVLALPLGTHGMLRYGLGRMLYNFGRVVTYSVMGGVIGLIGAGLSLAFLQRNVSIIAGTAILLAIIVQRVSRSSLPFPPFFGTVMLKLQGTIASLLKQDSLLPLFLLGMLNGLLPCGFVYLAITTAAVTADVSRGMMFMAGFGLGTIPAMVGFSFFPRLVAPGLRSKISRVLPAFTLFVGVLLIVRGLNLGIPFISPKLSSGSTPQMMHDHH
ncbi:MAG: sulfite exporter TauE/SafE family protein [Ignavibacteriales bacterium]|nr:sulfite exporter TauE/SafE family protein [Ignavibacteriales bacterium]